MSTDPLYRRVARILEQARNQVARTVNTAMVHAYWQVGREIVEVEQAGDQRAGYGENLLERLAARLSRTFGKGFSVQNLRSMRQFYLAFPGGSALPEIRQALPGESSEAIRSDIRQALPGESRNPGVARPRARSPSSKALTGRPGKARPSGARALSSNRKARAATARPEPRFPPALGWTHYVILMRIANPTARAFYEIEAAREAWSTRQLERQIGAQLFARLSRHRDPEAVRAMARRGQDVAKPTDVIKDPFVLEFLDLGERPELRERDVEQAIIDRLEAFLLELGKGFCFVGRQARLTVDGDHFYVDLVFYNRLLRCFVLVDLKLGKLTHQDLGQMLMYVNYYDRVKRAAHEHKTIGIVLCSQQAELMRERELAERQLRLAAPPAQPARPRKK